MSKPAEKRPSGRFSGFVLDPAQCCQLSLGQKRELIREIAQWPIDAPEILSSFTRKELLEIICAEIGEERKYSGYTKFQMIELLLKLVSQKSNRSNNDSDVAFCPAGTQTRYKRQKQNQIEAHICDDLNVATQENVKEERAKIKVCKNVACKASLHPDDAFCKRCSCCICRYYDDNKDPSLWLTCGSDSRSENACGLTCHLICALKDERSGITKRGYQTELDGSFYCVSCGKVNGIMGTCRKQLLVAKEARRVDILCLRVLLAYKILTGTEKYKGMQKITETALQMLKNELGPLDLVCAKMVRGIVNRLSCGAEVQKLCASAVEAFDSFSFSDDSLGYTTKKEPSLCLIEFEDLSPTSVVIVLVEVDDFFKDSLGCMLWHRQTTVNDYPDQPSFVILKPERRFKITDLSPCTEYICKVSFFGSTGILRVQEAKWTTPASNGSTVANGTIAQVHSEVKSNTCRKTKLAARDHFVKPQSVKGTNKNKNEGLCSLLQPVEAVCLTNLESLSPSTPSKSSGRQEALGLLCKKQNEETDYEYSVRVIKRLEQEGHIDEDFRVKFLTWFSLKATTQERRVVKAFVDALIEDPTSLAEQLMDAFLDQIGCERKQVSQRVVCTRLWH